MRLRFADARTWRYSIAALEDLVEAAVIKVSEEGLLIRAMDPAHVAMIEFSIPREGFDVFDVEKETKIYANLEVMMKILRRSSKKDEIELIYQPPNLRIGLISPEGVERYFEATALSPGAVEEPPELSLEFPVKASMIPQAFKSSYKIISEVGEFIELYADSEKLVMSTQSELSEVKIDLTKESGLLTSYEFNADKEQRSRYSIDYFDKVSKLAMIADNVELFFGEDIPVRIKTSLPRGAWLVLYVAPRQE
jgi:proliferating cell nuclear antigen